MPEANLLSLFAQPLKKCGVDYAITGSVGAMFYGEPRFTNDLDMVVDLRADQFVKFRGAFSETDFSVPVEDTLRDEISRETRGHANIVHYQTGLKADCYFVNADKLQRWAITKSRAIEVGGESYSFAPPEYVIIKKLDFHRQGGSEKHLRDIESMLRVSGNSIDLKLIQAYADELSLTDIWAKLNKSFSS